MTRESSRGGGDRYRSPRCVCALCDRGGCGYIGKAMGTSVGTQQVHGDGKKAVGTAGRPWVRRQMPWVRFQNSRVRRALFTNSWVRKMKIDSRTARAAAGEDVGENSCITQGCHLHNLLLLEQLWCALLTFSPIGYRAYFQYCLKPLHQAPTLNEIFS